MSSTGIDQRTGRVLKGWEHTKQSIRNALRTELGSRVLRRDLGAGIGSRIDKPQTSEQVMDLIIDVAEALEPKQVGDRIYGEPRFELRRVGFDARTPGHVEMRLSGIEYPNGHRGDFSTSIDRTFDFSQSTD